MLLLLFRNNIEPQFTPVLWWEFEIMVHQIHIHTNIWVLKIHVAAGQSKNTDMD